MARRLRLPAILCLVLVSAGSCRHQPLRTPQEVSSLVSELGAREYEVRQHAEDALVQMGEPAEPALREALNSADTEVRERARSALRRIADEKLNHVRPVVAREVVLVGGAVHSVAFSPDGKLLASGGDRGDVALWDVATHHRLVHFHANDAWVGAIAFSPDGRRLFTEGNGVAVWDVATQALIRRFPGWNSNGMVRSPDGKWILFSTDKGRAVRDMATLEIVKELPSNWGGGRIAFSRDGQGLISGDRHGHVSLLDWAHAKEVSTEDFGNENGVWDSTVFPDGNQVVCLDDHTVRWADVKVKYPDAPFVAVVSPDGLRLAVAGNGKGEIHIWDETGKELEVLKGHTASVDSLAFSPDGTMLASAGGDGDVRLWKDGTSAVLRGHASEPRSTAFTPDSQWLLAVGGGWQQKLLAVEVATGREADLGSAEAVGAGPTGSQAYVARGDEGMTLLDVSTGRSLFQGENLGYVASDLDRIELSPDGGTVLLSGRFDGVHLWRRGHEPTMVPGTWGYMYDSSWSPDGSMLAVSTVGGEHGEFAEFSVFDREGRKLIEAEGNFFSRNGHYRTARFDPTGEYIVLSDRRGTVTLDVHTWEPTNRSSARLTWWRFLNARTAVSYDDEGRLCVWDVSAWRTLTEMKLPGAEILALSPDRRWLAAATSDHVTLFELRP